MSATPRLALPFLVPGQAQKELYHNESLQLLDVLVAAAVEGLPTATPPAVPVAGRCYIVAASPTGDWAGQAQKLAAYTSGGWRFIAPFEGMSAFVRGVGTTAVYRGAAWDIGSLTGAELVIAGQKVVGARGAAIAGPTGGATSDSEARAAIGQILSAMRAHGLIEM